MFPVYYIFNFLMTLLLILHVIWYYYITLFAYKVNKKLRINETIPRRYMLEKLQRTPEVIQTMKVMKTVMKMKV